MQFFRNLISRTRTDEFVHRPEGRFLNVQIDLINRCNIKCIMCPAEWVRSLEAQVTKLGPALFERLAPEIFPRANYLCFSAGHEPLLVKELFDYILAAKEFGIPFVEIITNGLLLNEEKTLRLMESGLDAVVVSLDGAKKETYEKIRKGGNFETLLSNIRLFTRIRGEMGRQTPILKFNYTMMRSNVEEVPDFIYLARDLGASAVDIRHVILFRHLNISHESLYPHKELTNRNLELARKRAKEAGITLIFCPENFDLSGKPVVRRRLTRKDYQQHCPFPWRHLLVGPEGGTFPCCFWFSRESFGNFGEQDFDGIWNGKKYLELRRELTEGRPSRKCCRECFIFRYLDEPEYFSEFELDGA